MFMLIYLTLIFRVIGSWTLFSQIEMQFHPKSVKEMINPISDRQVLN